MLALTVTLFIIIAVAAYAVGYTEGYEDRTHEEVRAIEHQISLERGQHYD